MTEGIVEQYQNGEHVLGVLERENREENLKEDHLNFSKFGEKNKYTHF